MEPNTHPVRIRSQIEDRAAAWAAAGKNPDLLWQDWTFLVAWWWSSSPGGKAEGLSAIAQAFLTACRERLGTGYAALFRGKEECGGSCGWTWKYENLAFCTACRRGVCHGCLETHPRAANGNRLCRCGEGEMVG